MKTLIFAAITLVSGSIYAGPEKFVGHYQLLSREFMLEQLTPADHEKRCPTKLEVILENDESPSLRLVDTDMGVFLVNKYEESTEPGHAFCATYAMGADFSSDQVVNYDKCGWYVRKKLMVDFLRLESQDKVLVRGSRNEWNTFFSSPDSLARRKKMSDEQDFTCVYKREQ